MLIVVEPASPLPAPSPVVLVVPPVDDDASVSAPVVGAAGWASVVLVVGSVGAVVAVVSAGSDEAGAGAGAASVVTHTGSTGQAQR